MDEGAQAQIAALRARLAELSTAFEYMHQGLCMFDQRGRLMLGNRAYAEALGIEPSDLREGMCSREIITAMQARGLRAEATVEEIEEELHNLLRNARGGEAHLVRSDGHTFAIRRCRTPEGFGVATFADITDAIAARKNSASALRESEERFRLAAEAASLGVWDYDASTGKRIWSHRLREIFGFAEHLEASFEAAVALVHEEDRVSFTHLLYRIHDDVKGGRFDASVRIWRAADNEMRWVSVNGWKTVKPESPAGRIILTVRDITDEKLAEERIVWSALHDPLTGLANRSNFNARLESALGVAESDGHAVGLLLLDIDKFKQINDTFGHDAGDRLLQTFASRLQSIVRVKDTVGRLGGDEFAIILDCVGDEQNVQSVARSILERLFVPFTHEGQTLDCRASIGAALYPLHGRTCTELMKHADLALYASKAAGRGTSTMFDTTMKARAQRREVTIRRTREALDGDRLFPCYQPKVELDSGRIRGFEALLRWRSPQGRIVPPAALGEALIDLDLANAISDLMIGKVIADMRSWLDTGLDFQHVAVNASAAEFRKDDFAERVLERLARAGIPASHFEIEVTETVFLGRGAECVHRALKALSRAGVKIALDDFGTGYASLQHLKRFPVNTLKIDRSFVRDMEADAGDAAIVRAVINLGHNLGIRLVAEGIERTSQVERLIHLGCDYGQGFLFSKAVAAARIPSLLRRESLFPEEGIPGAAARLRLVAS